MAMPELWPIFFGSPSTPPTDDTTRYAGSGPNMVAVPPAGVPGYAMQWPDHGDFLEASNVGKHGDWSTLAALPPTDVLLLQEAAANPVAQGTRLVPAKLAAHGMIDVGDIIYGTTAPTLTPHVGLIP